MPGRNVRRRQVKQGSSSALIAAVVAVVGVVIAAVVLTSGDGEQPERRRDRKRAARMPDPTKPIEAERAAPTPAPAPAPAASPTAVTLTTQTAVEETAVEETAMEAPAEQQQPAEKTAAFTDDDANEVVAKLKPSAPGATPAKTFSWEQPHAKMKGNGDIEWTPRAYKFAKGDSVRYIDFERGSDSNSGNTTGSAWKHHPWDANATGNAAACSGIHTYVFKGGVDYRGTLTVKHDGAPGNPIRLTRDPSWGRGPASLLGSERVTGFKKGADHRDIPDPQNVWYADLDFAPRTLFVVKRDGSAVRIPLARDPNWKSGPIDHRAQWYSWTNDPHPFRFKSGPVAYDSKNLKGRDRKSVEGGLIYSEFGWVMGTPYPAKLDKLDPRTGGVNFGRWTGGGRASIIFRQMRYYLEDKPHYLDDPDGEFWFAKKGKGGRLYLRLPGNADPNRARVEAGKRTELVYGKRVKHLEISGLDFRFTNHPWALDVTSWDFSTKPWGFREDAHPAAVRIWGDGLDIRIANCRFADVVMPIIIKAIKPGSAVDKVLIEDNEFLNTDYGILSVTGGGGWGFAKLRGRLHEARVLRNHAREVGMRPGRYFRGTGMNFGGPEVLEVAGNVIERVGAQGINVVAAKGSGTWGDVPLSRTIIHNNKVWESLRISNDFGGIEGWQHGPIFIYNNLSYDARGLQEGRRKVNKHCPGFGHAYYLDGGFKSYLFNNIAWGRSNDDTSNEINCAAFQEIHSYQNMFFNNTAYNYYVGSRRQAPHAGRNKFLGNVWSRISKRVFRHSDPAKTAAAANAADAGSQKGHFATETNAYVRNVFHQVAQVGCFEPSGRWLDTVEDFRGALARAKSLESSLGVEDASSPLENPAKGDFRPARNSKAIDGGVVAFVPWPLHGVVGEWNFYHAGDDPTRIIDEHWYAKDYMVGRGDYHKMPMYPLMAVNVTADDYEDGPLENWTKGALRFTPEKKQYAAISNEHLAKPIVVKASKISRHEGGKPQNWTIGEPDLRTPQVHRSNFLIEAYFKTANGHTDGLILGKMKGAGYSLKVNKSGGVTFSVNGGGGAKRVSSTVLVNDGKWHHVIAECDRGTATLTLYVDGRKDTHAPGVTGSESLGNTGDVYAGGTPEGHYFDGSMDFLRIAHGTLADARTTIEELYKWEFHGPFLRDFVGNEPRNTRDAGAIERVD